MIREQIPYPTFLIYYIKKELLINFVVTLTHMLRRLVYAYSNEPETGLLVMFTFCTCRNIHSQAPRVYKMPHRDKIM